MKVIEATNRLDALKPNTYTFQDKLEWLNELDGRVFREVIAKHRCGKIDSFVPYDDAEDELLIPAPYDDVYIKYMEACIDYQNGETDRYENSAAMFEQKYLDFRKNYNETHMPIGRRFRYW